LVLLESARNDLGLSPGEEIMWAGDIPMPFNADSPMVLIASVASGGDQAQQAKQVLGACKTIQVRGEIFPTNDAARYMYQFRQVDGFSGGASAEIVLSPKNGVLRLSDGSTPDVPVYEYIPNPNPNPSNDVLSDLFEMSVTNDGVKVNIRYYINIESPDDAHFEYCEKPSWKISNSSPYGSDDLLVNNLLDLLAGASHSFVGFQNLVGLSLGETIGEGISAQFTLDDNAAGNGWFVDYTPWLNEEWLPTSNPYEWKAKEGSEAAGKMDLLSVLLHEYGHVLGLEHSADSNDFMGTTLTTGVRRLPSASEMQLMANLVADIKGETIPSLPTINQRPDPMTFGPHDFCTISIGCIASFLIRIR